jgi:hypothetical protein
MYASFVLLDLTCAALTLSMVSCLDGSGDPAYVSEWIAQCKRRATLQALPWAVFALFAVVVLWQLDWMYRVARAYAQTECVHASCSELSHLPMILLSWVSVAGLFLLIRYDYRSDDENDKSLHRLGVGLMTIGFFAALHVIWSILRTGDCIQRLNDKRPRRVPFYMWFQYDLVFVLFICFFIFTAFAVTGVPEIVSVISEYVALSLLFLQMIWLFLACCEREPAELGPPTLATVSLAMHMVLLVCLFSFVTVCVVAFTRTAKDA